MGRNRGGMFCVEFGKKKNYFQKILQGIVEAEIDVIRKLTGCRKPCTYRQYTFIGKRTPTLCKPKISSFSLWAFSNRTLFKTGQSIYPLPSLVAEFGGTLSLFIGFWTRLILFIKHMSHCASCLSITYDLFVKVTGNC